MTILFYLIVFLHVIACLFLIGVVLLQQGKGQDLASAFGGGGTQTAFGPRGSANVLSRATTILAGLFMVTSLAPVDRCGRTRARSSTRWPSPRRAPGAGRAPAPITTVPAGAAPAAPARGRRSAAADARVARRPASAEPTAELSLAAPARPPAAPAAAGRRP